MKFIKRLIGVVLLLLLLVIGGLVFAAFRIDALARTGIEKGATYALGVPTTLAAADVGLLGGTFSMSDLHVGNPPGFTSPHFLSLGTGGVAVSLSTLSQQTVELPSFSLDRLSVNLEKRGDAGTNYKVILANLDKLKGSSPTTKPASTDERRFIIRDLSIKNVNVQVDLFGGPGAIGELTKVNIPIDEIKLADVGKTGTGVAGSGVTMSELVSIIVQAVLGAAADKGGGLLPADFLGDLKGSLANLDGVKDLGMKVLGDAKGTIEEAGKKALQDTAKKAEDAVKDVLDKGLKDLFPGDKKK